MDEFYIEFILCGDVFDLDSVSSVLGLVPAKTKKKGEYEPKRTLPNKRTVWGYKIDFQNIWETEEKLEFLLALLEQHADFLTSLPDGMESQISIVMYLRNESHFGVCLSPEFLRKMAALRIPLDIDIYFLGGSAKEE